MTMPRRRTNPVESPPELADAGSLLAVEAIDPTGLMITSEGAFVRVVHVIPPNPIILSEDDRAHTAAAFSRLVSRLRPFEALQFYIDARPVNLEEILRRSRREVEAWSGEAPTAEQPARDGLSLSRWRLSAAMEESLRLHCDDQAAVEFNAYVVVPYVPSHSTARGALNQLRRSKLPVVPLERELKAHRRLVRESLAQTDMVRAELESLSLPTRVLNGDEVAFLLWSRFNPTSADAGRGPRFTTEVIGELEVRRDRDTARAAATKLREAVARSSLDFGRSRHHVEVERNLEQTIYASSTADATSMGWLMSAMLTRQPFSVSVHVRALDRRYERRRLKRGYRRLFAVNRHAEFNGHVPDFDRYAQEDEAQHLLAEMAGQERASLFRVSIYQSIRARGPEPDVAQLTEAVDYCADQIENMADCRVNRGEFQQFALWQSTLPLGRDVAGRSRRYATRNVGDTVPLVGTSCGSPGGIPFAFTDPGRTLELLDPYDRTHSNFTMLVNGRSGSGKTMAANLIVSRCVAHGAHAFVIDRAGHYGVLTRLIEGARQIEIGADDSPDAINPWDVEDSTEISLEKVSFLVSLHGVMMGDEGLTTLERAQIGAAVRAVYARAARTGERPREAMLRDELVNRADDEKAQGSVEVAAVLRSLAERLGEFCGDGSYAYLLDRETTISRESPLVVFDTRRCPEVVLRPVMFALVEYITRTVERHRDAHRARSARADAPMFTGRTVLLIDEAWHLVGRKETGEFANDLARRARHLGLFFVVMSQHLSDFSTEHGMALIRNSTMQLLFAQHPDEISFLREALQLSDEEASVISRLKTVKGSHSQAFWVNGSRGRGRVALRVGPVEYWCFTSDPVRDQPAREAAIARRDGDVWAAVTELASGVGG
jgi:molybdopterin converting factor small subunit